VITVECEGPFPYDHGQGDPEVFIASMEKRMNRKLAAMRASAAGG
jgi:hypothetical protein